MTAQLFSPPTPAISQRGIAAPASPIRRLSPLAVAAVARGITVYHVNIGQPDLPTPPAILDRLHTFPDTTIAYAPSPGLPAALKAWQTYYASVGIALETSDMLITAGGSEAILFALMSVADVGDEVIVFDPTYTNYNSFATAAQVRLRAVLTTAEMGYHLPPASIVEQAITNRTRAIMICNPNNPTGSVYTRAELEMLIDLTTQHNLFLIADEAYREYVFDSHEYHSLLTLPEAHPRAILVDSLSKRFNVCGARVGCLASHHVDVMNAALRFAQGRLSVASAEQLAMIPMLEHSHPYTADTALEYQGRRDAALTALGRISGVRFTHPEGAFYIIIELPVADSDDFARWLLTDFSHDNETVMVAPMSGFYVTPGFGKNAVRLAFVLEAPVLTRAIELLGIALAQYSVRVTEGAISHDH